TTESTVTRRRPCTVMVREGAPSTVCIAGLEKDVDGRPPPTMTVSDDSAVLAAIISRRTLMRQPHVGQILADVMAGGHRPPLQAGRRDDDAVPPQDRNGIGLLQSVPLEIAHHPGTLLRIDA